MGTSSPKAVIMDETADGVALMVLECAYHDDSGSMIGYSRTYTRSDKVSFKVSLHRLD